MMLWSSKCLLWSHDDVWCVVHVHTLITPQDGTTSSVKVVLIELYVHSYPDRQASVFYLKHIVLLPPTVVFHVARHFKFLSKIPNHLSLLQMKLTKHAVAKNFCSGLSF